MWVHGWKKSTKRDRNDRQIKRHLVSGGFYCGMGDIGFIYNMNFNRNMKKKNKLKRKATNSLKQVMDNLANEYIDFLNY